MSLPEDAPTRSERRGAGSATPGGLAPRRDWEWRRRIRANPAGLRVYRVAVAVAGTVVVVVGLILLPLPGPGWVIVFLGIGIWASEFAWARRLLTFAKDKVRQWTSWTRRQAGHVKAVLAFLAVAVVLAVCYGYLKWQGAPALLPDSIESWLTSGLSLPD